MHLFFGAAFAAILASLILAGIFMIRGGRSQSKSSDMMRALAVRVTLSVLLFLCILAAWRLGWIHPSGVPLGR